MNESYLEEHSSISQSELMQINQPNFVKVKKLIEQEIDLLVNNCVYN